MLFHFHQRDCRILLLEGQNRSKVDSMIISDTLFVQVGFGAAHRCWGGLEGYCRTGRIWPFSVWSQYYPLECICQFYVFHMILRLQSNVWNQVIYPALKSLLLPPRSCLTDSSILQVLLLHVLCYNTPGYTPYDTPGSFPVLYHNSLNMLQVANLPDLYKVFERCWDSTEASGGKCILET